jgi:hypothetical protein
MSPRTSGLLPPPGTMRGCAPRAGCRRQVNNAARPQSPNPAGDLAATPWALPWPFWRSFRVPRRRHTWDLLNARLIMHAARRVLRWRLELAGYDRARRARQCLRRAEVEAGAGERGRDTTLGRPSGARRSARTRTTALWSLAVRTRRCACGRRPRAGASPSARCALPGPLWDAHWAAAGLVAWCGLCERCCGRELL